MLGMSETDKNSDGSSTKATCGRGVLPAAIRPFGTAPSGSLALSDIKDETL